MVLVCVCVWCVSCVHVCLDTVRFVVGHGLLCVLLHKACVCTVSLVVSYSW